MGRDDGKLVGLTLDSDNVVLCSSSDVCECDEFEWGPFCN